MKKNNATRAALIAVTALLIPVAGQGAISTLPASGWDQDMIINNGQGAYNNTVTGTLDGGPNNVEGFTFGEAGTYPLQPDNTPQIVSGVNTGVYTSGTGSGASFQFQDPTSVNALLLNGGDTGTLTLNTPTALTTLALYGTTSGGPTAADVTLTFSDLSTRTFTISEGTGITADWFNNGSNTAALIVGDRISNRSDDAYTNVFYQADGSISIYESLYTLNGDDQGKLLTSVSINNTEGGTLAIMAISGDAAVPEASTVALLGACGALGLLRRRRSA
jgi:hypothetical protein